MSEKRSFFGDVKQWFSNVNAKIEDFFEKCVFGNPFIVKNMPVFRGVIIYLWFFPMALTLPTEFHFYCQSFDPVKDAFLYYASPWVEALFVFAILNSLIRTFAIYNRLEREAFLSTHKADWERKNVRKEILRDRNFWLELAVLQGFFLLHPTNWGFISLTSIIPTMSLWHPLLQKPVLCILFFGVTFWLELHSRMDARVVWTEAPQKLMQKNIWQSLSVKKHRRYHVLRMLGRLLFHTVIYNCMSLLLVYGMMFAFQFLMLFLMVAVQIWFWIILTVLICFRSVSALISRIRMIARLKKECRKNGFELFDLHAAYRAVFFDFQNYTFAVSANKKTYYCRLISCINRNKKICISPDGTLSRIRSIRLPGVMQIVSRGRATDVTDSDDLEIFRTSSSVDYTFEADGIKVLILNPVARRVFVEENGKTMAMDNGSRVGEYRVYTPNAFMRAVERDCVEK